MHELDMAAIMGGPMFRSEVDQLIDALQALHEKHAEAAAAADPPAAKRHKRCDKADAEHRNSRHMPNARRDTETEHRHSRRAPYAHSNQAAPANVQHGEAAAAGVPAAKRHKRCDTADFENGHSNDMPDAYSTQAASANEAKSSLSKRVCVSAFTETEAAEAQELHTQRSLTQACCQLPPGSLQAAGKKVPSEELPSLERLVTAAT